MCLSCCWIIVLRNPPTLDIDLNVHVKTTLCHKQRDQRKNDADTTSADVLPQTERSAKERHCHDYSWRPVTNREISTMNDTDTTSTDVLPQTERSARWTTLTRPALTSCHKQRDQHDEGHWHEQHWRSVTNCEIGTKNDAVDLLPNQIISLLIRFIPLRQWYLHATAARSSLPIYK